MFSEEWTEWHLTVCGWQRGSEQSYAEPLKERPVPSDRVLSCRCTETITSIHAAVQFTMTEEWRSPDQAAVNVLIARHSAQPEHL
jgi:hypothetical protein